MLETNRKSNCTEGHVPQKGAKLRWIAFDAVGTLIEPVPSAADAYYEVARRHGSRLSRDEISRRFQRTFRETERGKHASPGESRLATSESIEKERWRAIVSAVIDDVSNVDLCFDELFDHFARPESWKCFSDVKTTLDRLRRMGLNVAIASNFDGRLHGVCDGLDVLRDFACRVISAEVGFRKPSPRFFEALLSVAGCRPEELLMVGDDDENDCAGARRVGIDAVLVDRRRIADGSIGTIAELIPWLEDRKQFSVEAWSKSA
jgi:putative hydrolase of the HAD superfamily